MRLQIDLFEKEIMRDYQALLTCEDERLERLEGNAAETPAPAGDAGSSDPEIFEDASPAGERPSATVLHLPAAG
jgi:hypothetical protein